MARRLGINASQIAKEALIQGGARRKAERLQAEILQDLEAASAYLAKHGSFADMVREYHQDQGED